VGYPLLNVGGFNDRLGWATTNNDPDLDEVYQLEVDPARANHYLFDGRSVPLHRETVRAEYTAGDSLIAVDREVWRSDLGPVIHCDGDRIYVVRSPNDGEIRKAEQFLRMMRARNLAEWREALRLRAHTESNLTYADADGNVFYIWNASIPDRPHPGGGDSTAIPVADSSQVWSRLVPLDELPQLLNPPGGYVQNANDPFHFTNLQAPIDSAAVREFFPRPSLSFRSQLSLALATAEPVLGLEDVVRLKHSPRMLAAERLKDDLLAAVRAAPAARNGLANAVRLLESWDNTVAVDARGALLFETWFNRYLAPVPGALQATAADRWRRAFARPWTASDPTATPDGLADADKAVRDLVWAAADVTRRYGRLDPAWGDVHRVRRGAVDVPVAGCPGLLGCFRVLWFEDAADGKRVAAGGDAWVLAVEFGPVPRAVSVLAYGQSSRPNSPYFSDQAAMFARGELKRVAFTEGDIARGLVRRYRPE
jgi:acyl-homoserine-lactone acylase